MNFVQGNGSKRHSECTIFKNVHDGAPCFYPGPAVTNNGSQRQVVHILPAHASKSMGLLGHSCPVECRSPHAFVIGRVPPRAESVHRFVRVAGFAGEERCRRATTKPTYGRDCATAAIFYKHSSSCGPQVRVVERWTLNTCAMSVQAGGVATESCKWPGTSGTRFTWVLAWAGSCGCSAGSSTTAARSSSTTPRANTCSDSLACGLSTAGVPPRRKAARHAPRRTSPRGNGRCAILPRQQRTRTRKQSSPTLAGRTVA